MTAQTSYSINQPVAYAGLIYAQAPHDITSRSVETVAGIDFGVAVSRGTDLEKQIILGGDNTFLGVTIRDLGREGAANTGSIKYSETETAGVMRDGYVWVVCPSGCNPGDPVNYVDATGIIDSGAAVAGETDIVGATFETVAAAGELAVLRLKS
tara:strand:+ start:14730 stop:15191 length:462 start_codon:yes stop_codon:yes gene_type:complete